MDIKLFTIIAFVLAPLVLVYGQSDGEEPRVEKHQTVYHLLTAVSHEFGINRKMTIEVAGPLSIGFTYRYRSNYDYLTARNVEDEGFYWTIRPAVSGTFRYYYNLDKRQRKRRRTDRNAGNFVGFETNLLGPAFLDHEGAATNHFSTTLGPVWGIQRAYGKRFNFQASIGGGLGIDEKSKYFVFLGGVSIGFRLGKNRPSDLAH